MRRGRPSPLSCKITSACLLLLLKARLSQDLVCRLHAVAFAVHAGPPTALPVGHRCTVGVLAWTHWCATESRMTLGQCANPCCVLFGVVTSCVPCARARTSRSCATENTYTPARLEALFRALSRHQSQSFVSFHHIFCGLWVLLPTRHLVEDLIEKFLLVVCSVAIRLVHVNANLFLSR